MLVVGGWIPGYRFDDSSDDEGYGYRRLSVLDGDRMERRRFESACAYSYDELFEVIQVRIRCRMRCRMRCYDRMMGDSMIESSRCVDVLVCERELQRISI
jgi:hypothetical protein